MRIVVTGAGGMLGSDVVAALAHAGHEVVPLDLDELDIRDGGAAGERIAAARPEALVNCSGYTDVDVAEDDMPTAMAVNADGARHLAAAAAQCGARVLYVSTDYVFDGSKSEPYVESDSPRPLSVYGQSKLAGEHETAAANPRHQIVRSSWLFGAAGRNFVETMLALAAEHGEVRVVRDQIGCPTYTGHLAAGIARLLEDEAWGLFHIAGAGWCSWHEFAAEIFRQADVDCRLTWCTTAEFPRKAHRPPWSVLATERPDGVTLPDWREGLSAYLEQRTVRA
jgi:dTDP-4-dehydrorhamnose reductase